MVSHAYTKAVQSGYLDRHPFKGEVRLDGEKARTRYVEDWEIVEYLSIDSRRKKGSVLAVQAYKRIKLLTGMRRGDLLRLTMSDLLDDGIHVIHDRRFTGNEPERSLHGARHASEMRQRRRDTGARSSAAYARRCQADTEDLSPKTGARKTTPIG
ncbi:hypothetical protein LFL96_06430 [Paraburkholderia sp. D15]|uniref:hypothetical protein n=1 Tax=Paraburkholderia sp. D15 TaxID=2880218 RepID=UPI002478C941|nr:hypothetical protein [Paraburkholderia sp. D15]WGS51135.1 hypothetical protein LFL96_06430 [Paraburkholderia sp. D15]